MAYREIGLRSGGLGRLGTLGPKKRREPVIIPFAISIDIR